MQLHTKAAGNVIQGSIPSWQLNLAFSSTQNWFWETEVGTLPPAVEDSVWQDKSPFKETLSEAEGYTAVDSDVGDLPC